MALCLDVPIGEACWGGSLEGLRLVRKKEAVQRPGLRVKIATNETPKKYMLWVWGCLAVKQPPHKGLHRGKQYGVVGCAEGGTERELGYGGEVVRRRVLHHVQPHGSRGKGEEAATEVNMWERPQTLTRRC
jgi:hypothetical protein